MLDRIGSRAGELQRRGLRSLDALIIAHLETGDSVEQVALRLNVTVKAVWVAIRRGERFV